MHLLPHSDTSEKAIERYLVAQCRRRGLLCLKYANPTSAGYPDRLILLPEGAVVWVELKSRGIKPRLLQKIRHTELRRLGHRVEVADSREQIDEILKSLL